MALAARCPHCRALFRVVADQFKLRGGLVRCGECRKVFDAIGSLSYVDDLTLAKESAEATIGGSALPGPAIATPQSKPPALVPKAAPEAAPAVLSAGAPINALGPTPATAEPKPVGVAGCGLRKTCNWAPVVPLNR